MAWTKQKIKVYAKLGGIGLILLAVVIFILSNREPVAVKFLWKETPTIPMYLFIVVVGILSLVVYGIGRRMGRVLSDFRLLRSEEKAGRKLVQKPKEPENDIG